MGEARDTVEFQQHLPPPDGWSNCGGEPEFRQPFEMFGRN